MEDKSPGLRRGPLVGKPPIYCRPHPLSGEGKSVSSDEGISITTILDACLACSGGNNQQTRRGRDTIGLHTMPLAQPNRSSGLTALATSTDNKRHSEPDAKAQGQGARHQHAYYSLHKDTSQKQTDRRQIGETERTAHSIKTKRPSPSPQRTSYNPIQSNSILHT